MKPREDNQELGAINKCYEVVCENSEFVTKMKDTVTAWIAKSNGCYLYYCDNEAGNLYNETYHSERDNECYKVTCENGKWVTKERDNATEWKRQSNGCYEYYCDNETGFKSKETEHQYQENECYEVLCEGNGWIIKKKDNVTEWENRTSACAVFYCDNESGIMTRSNCTSTNEVHRACVNEKCVETETFSDEGYLIEVDLNGIDALGMTNFLEGVYKKACVKKEDVKLGTKIDSEGNIIGLVIVVDSQENAQVIADAINESFDEDSSASRTITAQVLPKVISEASRAYSAIVFFVICLVFAFISM